MSLEGEVVVVQLLSCAQLFVTLWTAVQASLSFTMSRSLLKLMSIESVVPSNHLVLCHPLLLSSIFSSIRVFSNESALYSRWPKYWSFSICPSNEYSGFPLGLTSLISLLSQGFLRAFSSTTVWKHQFRKWLNICFFGEEHWDIYIGLFVVFI